jgi:hypothetical protein
VPKVRLNMQLEEDMMERWKARARAANYSTLAEYVRHVMEGQTPVVIGAETTAPAATKGRGRPKKVSE